MVYLSLIVTTSLLFCSVTIQGHEDFLTKMEATNFVVDPTAFVQVIEIVVVLVH
jgi:hypothetical protein